MSYQENAEQLTRDRTKDRAKEKTESQRALLWLSSAILLGMLSVFFYGAQEAGRQGFLAFLAVVSTGCLLAGASACVGGIFGFLFGIPRTLQQEGAGSNPAGAASGGSDANAAGRRIDYLANTNLEQISDWLTKILVGIGLTQIPQIREGFGSFTLFAAAGLGSGPSSQLFAFALISYSTVLGFLFGYLWARLFLVGALRLADQVKIGALVTEVKKVSERAETTERKLEELKKQSALDAEALSLAYRQLNPSPELPDPSQDALDTAIAAAARPIKVQVFNQAWQLRGDNWRDSKTKSKMERAIPIFRALIRSDAENRYHMNHGQLGFALKDSVQPDWKGAEQELTAAIDIRGPWEKGGWLYYEFNRAICRMMNDPEFMQDLPSPPGTRDKILEDLQAVAHNDELKKLAIADPTVQKWMKLNNVVPKDLRHAGGVSDRGAAKPAP